MHTVCRRDARAAARRCPSGRKLIWFRGIPRARPLFLVIAGVLCPPGRIYRLRGIPFGWSRVVPLAERRPRTGAWHALVSAPLRGRRHIGDERKGWPFMADALPESTLAALDDPFAQL